VLHGGKSAEFDPNPKLLLLYHNKLKVGLMDERDITYIYLALYSCNSKNKNILDVWSERNFKCIPKEEEEKQFIPTDFHV
jgi:hypothetical protein